VICPKLFRRAQTVVTETKEKFYENVTDFNRRPGRHAGRSRRLAGAASTGIGGRRRRQRSQNSLLRLPDASDHQIR
jgi:hypothetical protein